MQHFEVECFDRKTDPRPSPTQWFCELGRRAIYFQGAGEQAHTLGDKGALPKNWDQSLGIWGDQNIIIRDERRQPPCGGLCIENIQLWSFMLYNG